MTVLRPAPARLRRTAAAFRQDRRGNVAILFTLAIVPILGLVGAAVDYSRANSARTAMQAALDATALMISRDAAKLSQEEITARAQAYFDASYNRPEATIDPLSISYTPNSGDGATVVVNARGSIKTAFMKLAGIQSIEFGSGSTTKWGSARLRVALALDNTGSMSSSGKMAAMQEAAKDLVDTLKATAKNDGDVYISIIPFAKDVNAGPSNYAADWLDWSEWEAEPVFTKPSNWAEIGPGSSCPFGSSSHGFTCTDRPATASGARSAGSIPSSGSYAGYICPSIDNGRKNSTKSSVYYNGCYDSVPSGTTTATVTVSSGRNASCSGYSNCSCSGNGNNKVCTQTTTVTTYTHNWIKNARTTWNGCVTDRNKNYDTTADPPSSAATRFFTEQHSACPTAITPLSYDWDNLKTEIDAMRPSGNTNQGIGMAWGWLSLLQQKPMNAPEHDANFKYNRVVILLSDGDNTQNRFSTSVSAIDARQKILCDNAKQAGIEVYTIQVNTDGSANSSVMQYCASSPRHFFTTTTAGGIAAAFGQIATQLSQLRIAK